MINILLKTTTSQILGGGDIQKDEGNLSKATTFVQTSRGKMIRFPPVHSIESKIFGETKLLDILLMTFHHLFAGEGKFELHPREIKRVQKSICLVVGRGFGS